MTALGTVLLLFAACLGAGAAVLACVRVLGDFDRGEAVAWSFAAGFGVIGWLVFFAAALGHIGWGEMLALCLVAAAGMILLPARSRSFASAKAGLRRAPPRDWIGRTLLVAIAVALVFDVLEGVSPPADADSLTYHFALPKQFLAAGRLEFVPRAAEGLTPLLPQMTYLLAFGLGGEIGLTLWTMVSNWMVSALLFVICRRYLGLNWSLAAALLFLTTPAVLYGGGTGQVEARLALFALAGAFAVSDAVRTGRMGYAVLAGLMAGFYAGGKYFGLLFAAACAVPLLARLPARSRNFASAKAGRRILVYGLAVLGAGSQWYGWNLYHTGDPIFPGLYAFLDIPDSAFWDQEHNAYFWNVFVPRESSVPVNLLWYLTYPFQATFGRVAVFESGRTGFGPYGLLVLPFAAAGVWRFRRRLLSSPLAAPAVITLVFYTLWFFSGASQHIRHLLPVYTVLVVCLTVAASRWADAHTLIRPLAAAAGLAILVQLGGHGLVALNYARYVLTDESREDFLRRNVSRFAPVPWINANLTANDRILLVYTPLVYLLEVPHYSAHVMTQILVDHTPRARDPKRFLEQLKAQGITHLLLTTRVSPETGTIIDTGDEDFRFWTFAETLRRAGCLTIVKTFETRSIGSRTLAAFQPVSGAETGGVLRLETEGCRP
jgi:hypothetical protein